MKRIIIILAFVFAWLFHLTALPVDQEAARIVAAKFMETNDLQPSSIYLTENNNPAFYIFNTPDGFVIVAGDDCETPIIGYSHEGRFDPNNVPVQMEDYLQDFVTRIQYGIVNHIVADEITKRQWELVKTTGRLNDLKNAKAVEPLITAQWRQGCLYNNLCPPKDQMPCGHTLAGCVAVAMGQVMHYWNYPDSGWDTHTYTYSNTEIFTDFGNTVYDWERMPDSLNQNSSEAEVEAVATLLFHCGAAVEMRYGISGSFADAQDIPYALKHYFKYSKLIHGEKQSNNNEQWLSMLKNSLDLQCPIIYSGSGNAGGHAFVCDGYDSNDLLHFNWGWGGSCNGYFALGNLNPNTYQFNNSNYAIFGISPDHSQYQVSVTVFPPESGHIEGLDEFHIGDTCTLKAIPEGEYEFSCWIQNGNHLSSDSVYTTIVMDDIDGIQAYFTLRPAAGITATIDSTEQNNPVVSLSWANRGNPSWQLLKQFDIAEGMGAITDQHFIYTYSSSNYYGPMFRKYTMDGVFIEEFDVPDCKLLTCLAFDGTYFYGSGMNESMLYTVDLEQKQLIEVFPIAWQYLNTPGCAYDAYNDGFWFLGAYRLSRIDRQGHWAQNGPPFPDRSNSLGFIQGSDCNNHLLISTYEGLIYDYNIDNDMLDTIPIGNIGTNTRMSIGEYDGKKAMFVCNSSEVKIYKIGEVFSKVMYYRLYRIDEHENRVMIADEVTSSSFVDATWDELDNGLYRYGVCSVFFSGDESEILWSDPIMKTGHGIDEQEYQTTPDIQKVFEGGQIIIIKDGNRYNVVGQKVK